MSLLGVLWPRRSNPADLNPTNIFDGYIATVATMAAAAPAADDEKLLDQSWKIFDNESGRRTSIDTRAAALMPAISLAATLVTGVGFTVLKDTTLPVDALAVILATYVLALVYLVRTMLLLFVIHGQIFRHTPDPSDLPTPAGAAAAGQPSPYDRGLACRIMRYTIENYRINNVQTNVLVVAQQSFRNAIIAIAVGGTVAGILIFGHGLAASVGKRQATAFSPSCAAFRMQGGAPVCVAELPPNSSSSSGATGRTYVAAPLSPIDLVDTLTKAIETTANEAKRFSSTELARRAAETLVASTSDELGKQASKLLFSAQQSPRARPTAPMLLIVDTGPPPPAVPLPPAQREYDPIQIYPFAVNSVSLPSSEEWRRQVGLLIGRLRGKSCEYEVRGFADRSGDARRNLYLSLQRAVSVADYLESQGTPRQQIAPVARGALGIGFEPDDARDLVKNRRVEVLARCAPP